MHRIGVLEDGTRSDHGHHMALPPCAATLGGVDVGAQTLPSSPGPEGRGTSREVLRPAKTALRVF